MFPHQCAVVFRPVPHAHRVELGEYDEFLILGCDGIWDCLTNEKAVAYVRARIDHYSPTQIGVEMLNDILSEDPRATQGIGGDNMTIMIVDLQPRIRRWRMEEATSSPAEPERPKPTDPPLAEVHSDNPRMDSLDIA